MTKRTGKASKSVKRAKMSAKVPVEPTYGMLLALAGDPIILAISDELELRARYSAMLAARNLPRGKRKP